MDRSFFIESYESKSDAELEEIARDSKTYVLDARFAAIVHLKNRESKSPLIKIVEEEERNNRIVEKRNSLMKTIKKNT